MSSLVGPSEDADSAVEERVSVPPLFQGPLREDLHARVRDALAAGDHEKAAVLLREADREFGTDSAFSALRIACLKLAHRKSRCQNALDNAAQELSDDRFAASLGKFREALSLARGYEVLLRQACLAGLNFAATTAKTHWRFASEVLREVVAASPEIAVPPGISTTIETQKREESIRVVLDESGKAEHSAYLSHMHARLSALAETYPDAEPLHSRLHFLDGLLVKRAADEREKNLRRLTLFRDRLDLTENPGVLRGFHQLVAPFADPYADDPSFAGVIAEVSELSASHEAALQLLEQNNTEDALKICEQVLRQRPANKLFCNVEEKAKAKEWSARLAKSVAERARQFEEHGQYSAALEEWDALRDIDSHYPGLDSEVLHCVALKQQMETIAHTEVPCVAGEALTPEILQPEQQEEIQTPAVFSARPYLPAPSFRSFRLAITSEAWNHLKTGLAATLALLLVVLVFASNSTR